MAFLYNCRHFSWIFHWNSRNGNSKKTSCNMESETISMKFSCTSTLKSICVSFILKALLPTHDFVTWCIHLSFGKYWLTEFYTGFPIGDAFYYRIWKKITFFVNTTIELIKYIFKLGSWQAHDGRYNFSKTLIFTWKHKCYYW